MSVKFTMSLNIVNNIVNMTITIIRRMMMKKLMMIVTVMTTINTLGANFECEFKKGWDRPKNDNAVKLAKALKVKTCNSQKFQDYVKENGHTMTKLVRNSNGGVEDLKFN